MSSRLRSRRPVLHCFKMTNPRPTSFATIAKEELICPICYELMKAPNIPKDLPGCEHVVCEVCIHRMMIEKQSGEDKEEETVVIICPECRSTNRVPSEGGGGIACFKTNMRLRNLAEKQSDYETQKLLLLSKAADTNEAHQQEYSKTADGKTTGDMNAADDGGVDSGVDPTGSRQCPRHHTQDALFYCLACDEPICQLCLVPDHLKHDVKEQDDLIREQQTHIEVKIKATEEALRCQETIAAQYDRFESELQRSLETEREKITQCVDQRIAPFRQDGKRLRDEMDMFESQQPYLGIIQEKKKLFQVKLDILAKIREDVEQMDDDHAEILNRHVAITMQLEELCREQPPMSLNLHTANSPKFIRYPVGLGIAKPPGLSCKIVLPVSSISAQQPPEVPPEPVYENTLTRRQSRMGDSDGDYEVPNPKPVLKTVAETSAINLPLSSTHGNPKPVLKTLRLLHEFGDFLNATSVDFGNDTLAVCDSKRNTVIVYRKIGTQFQEVAILNSTHPRDVAAMPDYGAIVIANSMSVEIFWSSSNYEDKTVIQTTGRTNKAKIKKDAISSIVNCSGGVGGFLVGDTARNVITRHDALGKLLQSNPVSVKPFRMAAMNHDRVAVADINSGKILILDFTGSTQTTFVQVNRVQGICSMPPSADDDDGKLLLVSRKPRALSSFRFSPSSNHGGDICVARAAAAGSHESDDDLHILAEGLHQPSGMAFISDTVLAVADGKTVKIYQCVYA